MRKEPNAVRFSSRIYGREEELSVLKDSFKWASLGSTELVLISGSSGIGKTALVEKAFKPTLRGKCYFASGKFDQINPSSPYEPIIRCFQFVIQQLLTEPEPQIRKWVTRMEQAIGSNGTIIAEVIPEVRWLLGDLLPSEHLPAAELQKRFEWVFRRFVQVFTQVDHPLVLFFDDVQWADKASLRLIDSILTDPESQHLVVIVAYRDQEGHENVHILDQWTQRKQEGLSIRKLSLAPLELTHIQTIVSESLQCDPKVGLPIAQTLYTKSIGNPYFLQHLLKSAHEENYLNYDMATGSWAWDMQALDQLPDIDGQLDYFMTRIHRLPNPTKQLLATSACLGGTFHIRLLSAVSHSAEDECMQHLSSAVQEGFLFKDDGDLNNEGIYRFSHDQIQQAAYSLLDRKMCMNIHASAGRFLLEYQSIDDSDQSLFDTANHFNQAVDLLSADEREKVAELNVKAGKKAMKSSAFSEALQYFSNGIACLTSDCWSRRFEFTFELHLLRSECEYLCSHYERADAQLNELSMHARHWTQRAQVYILKIKQYSNRGRYAEAIELGLQSLKEAGIRLSAQPKKYVIVKEIFLTQRLLNQNMQQLSALEETDDPRVKTMMNLVMALLTASFFGNRELFAVLAAKFIRWVFKNGNTPEAGLVYTSYGIIMGTMLGDYSGGYRLGTIALELAERSGIRSVLSKVYVMFYGVISPWIHYDHKVGEKLLEASKLGMEAGEYVYASFAMGALQNWSYARDNMRDLQMKARNSMQFVELTNEQLVLTNALIYAEWARKMQSTDEDAFSVTDGRLSEKDFMEEIMNDESQKVTLYQIYTYKIQLYYLFGHYREALYYAELANPYENISAHSPHLPAQYFYEAMAIAAAWHDLPVIKRKSYARRFKQLYRQFKKWVQVSPSHFKQKFVLLQAEWARVKGAEDDVIDRYDMAIQLAQGAEDYRHVAVACERAARHHLQKGRSRIALGYLLESYEAYDAWGMEIKRKNLREEFPEWLQERQESEEVADNNKDAEKGTSLTNEVNMDLAAIVKASMSLSQSLDLQHILQQLMKIFIQTAKASKVCLIVNDKHNLRVEQVGYADKKSLNLSTALLDSEEVPISLIQYSSRLEKIIQIEDISQDELFQTDPYVVRNSCKQVCCLPIFSQKQFSGVLYFEDTDLELPLSEATLETLRILSAQAIFVWKLSDSFGDITISQSSPSPQSESESYVDALTKRELEVLNLMAAGMTNKEIAIELGITAGTVKVHTHNIFSKLNVNRRTKAVAEGIKLNLLN